ncbi:MAG: hypothetical protein H7235_03700 [Bdellovibrionaceae bacterium]|nr:hypothetical protein [Pseudobdellovibrionaceae bacterium]
MDLKQRLEYLDMLISNDTKEAISCYALKWYMDYFFYQHTEEEIKRLFKTNIANTFLYQVNFSHFKRCIVSVSDQIHEELNRAPAIENKILHRWDLKNHRDYLSHPGKGGRFDNPTMKKFIEEDRQYKEPIAIFLWNARQSILESLSNLGSEYPKKNPTYIGLSNGMIEIVQGAIHYSLNDEAPRPSAANIKNVLQAYFISFQKHLSEEAEKQFLEKS